MQSGKSKTLKTLGNMVCNKFPQSKLYVFDGQKKALADIKDKAHKYVFVDDTAEVTEAIDEIINHLNQRKTAQNSARQNCNVFDEKEFIQSYPLLCIIIDDLREFVDAVTNEDKDSMERICRLAQNLGVVVLCGGRVTDITQYNEIESLTRVIVSAQNGLVVSGTPAQHSYFQNNLTYSEKDKEAGDGFGYIYENGKCYKAKLIR